MRTLEEIKTTVDRLLLNRSKTKQFNGFGKNNYENIDATIRVIQEDLSEEDIEEEFPEFDENDEFNDELYEIYSSAMLGRSYLDGEVDLEEMLYPEYE